MMKLPTSKHLGPLEARIMAVMWRHQRPLSVRVVLAEIGEPEPAYTTVMTIMGRLHEKRLLRRRPEGKAFVYSARMSEAEFLSFTAKRTVRQLVVDFGDVALAEFADELQRAGKVRRRRLEKLRDSDG